MLRDVKTGSGPCPGVSCLGVTVYAVNSQSQAGLQLWHTQGSGTAEAEAEAVSPVYGGLVARRSSVPKSDIRKWRGGKPSGDSAVAYLGAAGGNRRAMS
jgi:hypothetical protein